MVNHPEKTRPNPPIKRRHGDSFSANLDFVKQLGRRIQSFGACGGHLLNLNGKGGRSYFDFRASLV